MDILILILGLAILVVGAEILIRGSVSFGKKLNISLFAIGVVIVAAGTSLPELASSINAVLNNHSDLALGAVVGSNIANLILVMAATTIIVPITNITNNQINQAWINIALGICLIIMSYFYFNYLFGIISLIVLTLIMYFQIKKGSIPVDDIDKDEYSIFISLILIIFGVMFLIYGSDLFVNSAINSALRTVSPAGLSTFETTPSNGATTSSTTLSVSISAITSSCLTRSPSFFTQFAIVPSATDSGNVGDLISVVILFLFR